MNRLSPKRRTHSSEDGYVLVAVIFMAAILVLSLSIAVPKVRQDIQRDRERETMQRGKQYTRAVQLYYRKFHAYPPNIDALVKTNDIRFLRKKYSDPTTGKDEWTPVQFGKNKTPAAMGFFGQPLAGATVAGIGPSGGTSTTMSSGLFNTPTSPTTTTPSTDASATGAGQSSGTDANGNPIGGTVAGTIGTTQAGSTQTGSTFGSANNPTGSGQAFGGAGIIGFSPQSPKQSIIVFKKKNHYNEWEFLYDPIMDQRIMTGGNTGTVGQPASSITNSIGSGTNNTNTTNPMTPTAPTTQTPTTPQQ
jgi:type II secretory pathway pseudopilin PulG